MKPVQIDTFLKLIEYTPKRVGKDMCGVAIIQFRDWKNKTAHIEFSTETPQRSYFEIIDWTDYVDGDFIPLNSERRIEKYYFTLDWDNISECANYINKALNNLYGKRVKRCSYVGKTADISEY